MSNIFSKLLPTSLRLQLALRPYQKAFSRLVQARKNPHESQLESLLGILKTNKNSEFGRSHGFSRIKGLNDFVSRVPLRHYHDFKPYVKRQLDGDTNVLIDGKLVGFCQRSNLGHQRLISISEAGFDEAMWCESLLIHKTLSLAPNSSPSTLLNILPCFERHIQKNQAIGDTQQRSGLPMNIMLSQHAQRDKKHPTEIPVELFTITNEDIRYYLILRFALGRNLTILRAENPGTLTVLAKYIEQFREELISDYASGEIRFHEKLDDELKAIIPSQLSPAPKAAERIKEESNKIGRLEPRHLWPNLSVLICDTQGPARQAAKRLYDYYGDIQLINPGIRIAGGQISLPSRADQGGLAIINGQFLEFLDINDDESHPTIAADALKIGHTYKPVLTNKNGLYRYLVELIVEVTDIVDNIPRLQLVSRQPSRVLISEGVLEEKAITQAIFTACQAQEILATGMCAWVTPSKKDLNEEVKEEQEPSFWNRIFRRDIDAQKKNAAASHLTWAIETEQILDKDKAKKLLSAIENALTIHSKSYAESRATNTLSTPHLLILKKGSFAEERRKLITNGIPNAHHPEPVLRESPWHYALDRVEHLIS